MANYESENDLQVAEPPQPTVEEVDVPAPEPVEAVEEVERPGHYKSVVREYFESIVVTLVMALFGMTFITQAVKVPTGSMLNTILVEDHLLVNKFALSPHASFFESILPYRAIRRGDIIVFKYPKNPEENYVKRVIGLPGDTVLVRGTRVFVNGQELPENKAIVNSQLDNKADLEVLETLPPKEGASYTAYYLRSTEFADGLPEVDKRESKDFLRHGGRETFGIDEPYVVPEDSYFCMGDNRDNSEDSRYWGRVPRENVVGRAMFVYWSINESEREQAPTGSFLSDITRYSRWNRTGTLIK